VLGKVSIAGIKDPTTTQKLRSYGKG